MSAKDSKHPLDVRIVQVEEYKHKPPLPPSIILHKSPNGGGVRRKKKKVRFTICTIESRKVPLSQKLNVDSRNKQPKVLSTKCIKTVPKIKPTHASFDRYGCLYNIQPRIGPIDPASSNQGPNKTSEDLDKVRNHLIQLYFNESRSILNKVLNEDSLQDDGGSYQLRGKQSDNEQHGSGYSYHNKTMTYSELAALPRSDVHNLWNLPHKLWTEKDTEIELHLKSGMNNDNNVIIEPLLSLDLDVINYHIGYRPPARRGERPPFRPSKLKDSKTTKAPTISCSDLQENKNYIVKCLFEMQEDMTKNLNSKFCTQKPSRNSLTSCNLPIYYSRTGIQYLGQNVPETHKEVSHPFTSSPRNSVVEKTKKKPNTPSKGKKNIRK